MLGTHSTHKTLTQRIGEETSSTLSLLLVEDEAIIALATSTVLKRSGYSVELAYTGADAIEKAVADSNIQLILMDIDLGRGMDGTEAASKILSAREVPIIFLTSHAEEEYVQRVEKITRYGYVLKNSGHFVLIQAIKMAMELYRSKRKTEQHLSNSLLANAKLEKSQTQHSRIKRLYTTLRRINGIIADTGELDPILQEACDTFVMTSGYYAAWIVLSAPTEHTRHGYMRFNAEKLVPPDTVDFNSPVPRCAELAIQSLQPQYMAHHDSVCTACAWIPRPQDHHHEDYPSITVPLHVNSEILGWMTMILPPLFTKVADEMELLREIAHAISMAVVHKGKRESSATKRTEVESSPERRSEEPPNEAHYLEIELYNLIQNDPGIFEFLKAGSLDGLWYWDLIHRENEWMSPEFWRLFGYEPHEKTHSPAEWQDMIFQEDLTIALENFSKHLENPEHPYDQIVRYRHKDGSTVWVRCRGIAIRDQHGEPIRMLGAHNDITEQMRTKQRLIEQLELRETLLKKLSFQAKNNLLLTSALIEIKETEKNIDLRDLKNRIKSIEALYQKLYESDTMLQISIGEYLQELIESSFSGALLAPVETHIDLPQLLVESQKAVLIGLLLNEFAYIAIAGGISTIDGASFRITGRVEDHASRLVLEIEYGADEDPDLKDADTLFGFPLAELLLRELGGRMETRDQPTSGYKISIPLQT